MKRHGFTLVEILIVTCVLALMFSLSFRTFPAFSAQVSLNGAAKALASELRALQSKAVLEHETLSFDPGKLKLPAGIDFTRTSQISFSASGFTPPGGSGTLVLQNRLGKLKKIIVSSSGRVRIE